MSVVPGVDDAGEQYGRLLADVLAEVRAARIRAGQAINAERTMLYWRVGHLILARQAQQGWGASVIDRLAADLAAQFPGTRGWSARNLRYMRTLADSYPTEELATAVANLPWGHLTHHITIGRVDRAGHATDNFAAMMPAAEQDLVREVLADPDNLEFLALDPHHSERQLEDALVAKLSAFLTELGSGFAFVGRQYALASSASM